MNPMITVSARLVGPKHVKAIGVKVKTLRHWRQRKTGPPYCKLGHLVRYRPLDIERWAQNNRVATNQERRA